MLTRTLLKSEVAFKKTGFQHVFKEVKLVQRHTPT